MCLKREGVVSPRGRWQRVGPESIPRAVIATGVILQTKKNYRVFVYYWQSTPLKALF